jgi:hypothetical protein
MALAMRQSITRWMYRWLKRDHGESLLLPSELSSQLGDNDGNTEESRANWREAARARAICEAEDAGLRGTERQAFITGRTEIYYAELESLLADV